MDLISSDSMDKAGARDILCETTDRMCVHVRVLECVGISVGMGACVGVRQCVCACVRTRACVCERYGSYKWKLR